MNPKAENVCADSALLDSLCLTLAPSLHSDIERNGEEGVTVLPNALVKIHKLKLCMHVGQMNN